MISALSAQGKYGWEGGGDELSFSYSVFAIHKSLCVVSHLNHMLLFCLVINWKKNFYNQSMMKTPIAIGTMCFMW